MSDLTQDQVDEMVVGLKEQWDSRVAESGYSEQMFVVMDQTGFARPFLYQYDLAQKEIQALGLVMPDLVEGLTITECDDEPCN